MNRREFVMLGLLFAGWGCRGRSKEEIARLAGAYDADLECTETAGLWPVEVETRTTNEYVDRSPRDDRYCFICANYIAPARPAACATCRTVKGPVHPLGWCKAWTAQ